MVKELYRRFAIVRLFCDAVVLVLGAGFWYLSYRGLFRFAEDDVNVKNAYLAVAFPALIAGWCWSSVDKRWGWGFLFFLDPGYWVDGDSDSDSDGGFDGGD